MKIPSSHKVDPIGRSDYSDWLLKKHYAKRIPLITHAFGLFDTQNAIMGVCTFGPPAAKSFNHCNFIFKHIRMLAIELNRLVVNEGLEKNCLSYFVSQCIKKLPECCIISYADSGHGHHGYIYQATNWIYTGIVKAHTKRLIIQGKEVHNRTATGHIDSKTVHAHENSSSEEMSYKHRYFYFNANKKLKQRMRNEFLFDALPYPKGENERYDTGAPIVNKKNNLFNL